MAHTDDRLPDRPGGDDPGRGRRLGVDVGTVRIGVAASDPDGILATPVETVRGTDGTRPANTCAGWRSWSTNSRRSKWWWDCRAPLPTGPVRPRRTRSSWPTSSPERIAPMPVRLADERLTTVTAQRSLREAGVRAKGQRAMIDQAAAVGILQNWLDQRRAALRTRGAGRRCRARRGRG